MNADDVDNMLEAAYEPAKGDTGSQEKTPADRTVASPSNGKSDDTAGLHKSSSDGGKSKKESRDRDRRSSDKDRDRNRDRDKDRSRDRRRERSRSPRRRRSASPHSRRRRSPSPRSRRRRSPSPRRRSGSRRSPSPRRRSRSPQKVEPPAAPEPVRERSPQLTDQERDMRTVMVMQLPRNCKPRDLMDHFAPAGKVRDAKLIADRNSRRSKGIAYVEFVNPESVQKALEMNGQRLGPAPLIIMMTQSEKNRIAALKEKEGTTHSGAPTRVSVTNLPANINAAQLEQLFQPFAEAAGKSKIKETRVNQVASGADESEGYIDFENPAAAQMAVDKMNNIVIIERQIRVSLAATDESMSGMPGAFGMGAVPMHMGGASGLAIPPGMLPGGGLPGMMMPPPGMVAPGMGVPVSMGGMVVDGNAPSMLDNAEVDHRGIQMTMLGRHNLMAKLAARTDGLLVPPPPVPPAPMVPAPPPQVAPTRNFVLNNMFDPTKETDADWDKDIREEVLEECTEKFGPVAHIHVDKHSQGHVYVKFLKVESAIAARTGMNGRFFAGQMITVSYIEDNKYNAKFPEALHANTALVPQ